MVTDERTQRPLGSATIISRRRFLKQTAMATAVASVPYLAGRSAAFSGAVALSLVSKGKLSLHDTIGKRLRELPEAWWEVTLRQLLNHTSGIPDLLGDPAVQEALPASPRKPLRLRSCSS